MSKTTSKANSQSQRQHQRQNLKVNVNVNVNVKGFRAPGATYFLLSEKKVGQESGLLAGGAEASRGYGICGFVVGVSVLLESAGTGADGHYTARGACFVVMPLSAGALLVRASAVTGSGGHGIVASLVSWWAWWTGGRVKAGSCGVRRAGAAARQA
ncbi:hypothetical protein [Cupriavidus sp. M-11]|uniref:hypothetical protein n=1 Tax=Cupriavidus sp. M-11 TaxID=3233038 RepID=UPI003F906650